MNNDKVRDLTRMGVLAALTLVATILIRIPVPATQGYIHPGDAVLILSAWMIGQYKGSFAGALGQGLADLFGGYAIFAPFTLIAKMLMGILLFRAGMLLFDRERTAGKTVGGVICLILAFAAMAGTYYLVESAMYGSFLVPIAEIPANLIQFAFGTVMAFVIAGILMKTPASSGFAFRRES